MGIPVKALFTVEEAVRTLPLVRAIVADLVEQVAAHRATSRAWRDAPPASGERRLLEDDLRLLGARVQGCLDELAALGLEVRDLELGHVDFPTLMGSEPAFLCWQLGEPTVTSWHSADTGHRTRQPLAAGACAA
ncbi:MAG: DUF2203 domain-containing protein [Planctomycetia bacterium]